MLAGDNSGLKTNLAVSSTEFCQSIFDKRDISRGLCSGSGHGVMIPPLSLNILCCRVRARAFDMLFFFSSQPACQDH